jgi:hypothetical protein
MSKAINIIKHAFAWQADFAEAHPCLSVGAIWILAVLAIAF